MCSRMINNVSCIIIELYMNLYNYTYIYGCFM